MNIEIGEYVRTKQGDISKVRYIDEENIFLEDCVWSKNDLYEKTDVLYFDDEEIAKHSKNIIDLIEVGDIVKVEGIEHVREVIEDDFFNGNIFNNDVRAIINDKNYSKQIKEYQIKSIVTKQQFSNMEYRL